MILSRRTWKRVTIVKIGQHGKPPRYKPEKEPPVYIPQLATLSEKAIERFKKRKDPTPVLLVPKMSMFDIKKRKAEIAGRNARSKELTRSQHLRSLHGVPSSVPDHLIDWFVEKINYAVDATVVII